MLKKIKTSIHSYLLRKFGDINRQAIANYYLKGNGLEIGAMSSPLIPLHSNEIIYLDRCSKEDSLNLFPELNGKLVDVNLIFNIENIELNKIGEFDFIIANHVLEHVENPISVFKGLFDNLKPNGKLFLALPDKRFTFDIGREITDLNHLIDEYENGFEKNRMEHYYDFVKNTEHGFEKNDTEIEIIINELQENKFSIHFHVWDHKSYLEFFDGVNRKYNLPFRIIFSKESNGEDNESIFVFEKS